ncbi:acetate/propionate family kinase [Kushneria indalinina]|uniref:Acetate kinase n=1 Tax=Kushneria indalinina DSM 14324 TaxID=1122140 RepID=A0A3D9DUD9_9GAMM|nr:acetate/propionate family kinase [Kushneria indalinina]REC94347.1 acetate kinase [Kushneria indalinina DSM 14324]
MAQEAAPVIIVVNAGSSSLKLSVYFLEDGDALRLAAHGAIEEIGADEPHLQAAMADGSDIADEPLSQQQVKDHGAAYQVLRERMTRALEDVQPMAVGHRVLHGGRDFSAPVVIDEQVRQRLDELIPLAPLHQPHNLTGIDAVSRYAPEVLQVACFDTAFHHQRPELSMMTGLPWSWFEKGLQRYGFHGLSYEYIAHRLPELDPALAKGHVIVAHLGNGASLCAMTDCRSMETTMSFTALDGLPMGTRCGALDPGTVLYLQQQHGLDNDALQDMLYKESGLKGISGISSNMQTLLDDDSPQARRAIDFFVYRTAQEIGRMAVAVGGFDGLVFTGGIGEHAAPIRQMIVDRLKALFPVALDHDANGAEDPDIISTEDSAITVRVIPTDEEGMLARHTVSLLRRHADQDA